MKFITLSKEEAREEEQSTVPVLNFSNDLIGESEIKKFNTAIRGMHEWSHDPKLKTNKDMKNYLIKKLGKPLYHANYEYQNAVWGFYINDRPVIVYYCKRGLSIQTSRGAFVSEVLDILKKIRIALKDK